ncbi:bacteriophage replication [Burkholderia pseudomallei]|nr:bacteriophage replication [Burkholderia pseudomallei]CAJ4653569.1 bacteriophage replication [Burkholderia pseudomallei]CAJ6144989.1 bacteriophage replication [Burkholderia pseudomallei]CAJ8472363.1 bacteriophage replication [Burkholderia pseudomallei]CAK0150781.1 bacteriophage replication [Burkholderia pseudomallei]
MALLTSFDAINPRMPQVVWREAMLGKLPVKWACRVSRRLEILDRQHRDWYHGNVYLREHVAEYADALFPLQGHPQARHCQLSRTFWSSASPKAAPVAQPAAPATRPARMAPARLPQIAPTGPASTPIAAPVSTPDSVSAMALVAPAAAPTAPPMRRATWRGSVCTDWQVGQELRLSSGRDAVSAPKRGGALACGRGSSGSQAPSSSSNGRKGGRSCMCSSLPTNFPGVLAQAHRREYASCKDDRVGDQVVEG